jgi:hypothetical protein
MFVALNDCNYFINPIIVTETKKLENHNSEKLIIYGFLCGEIIFKNPVILTCKYIE